MESEAFAYMFETVYDNCRRQGDDHATAMKNAKEVVDAARKEV